jgi:divalent metal cation (Fe/Co/Zn/Cd) transporter
MKLSHKFNSGKAGPVWGVAFGLLVTSAGVGLWYDAQLSVSVGRFNESLSVAAILIGVLVVTYAVHELRHR